MNAKHQLNIRVKPAVRDAVTQVCERLDWTRDDLAEVAIASLLGSRDNLIKAKRDKCVQIAKELKIVLSFDLPGVVPLGLELLAA